jgi:hypothetical protein
MLKHMRCLNAYVFTKYKLHKAILQYYANRSRSTNYLRQFDELFTIPHIWRATMASFVVMIVQRLSA